MTYNTLRDQFAMAALTGLLGSGYFEIMKLGGSDARETICATAYKISDSMLAERKKPKANEGAEK